MFNVNGNLSDDSLITGDESISVNKKILNVWELFYKIQNEKSGSITNYKCTLYTKLYSSSNPTSTLRHYLTSKHTLHYQKPECHQTTLHFKSYSSLKSKPITDSLIDFVVTDLQPFTIVKNPEFKLLVNKLDLCYILLYRQTLKENFIKNYSIKKNNLINEIL